MKGRQSEAEVDALVCQHRLYVSGWRKLEMGCGSLVEGDAAWPSQISSLVTAGPVEACKTSLMVPRPFPGLHWQPDCRCGFPDGYHEMGIRGSLVRLAEPCLDGTTDAGVRFGTEICVTSVEMDTNIHLFPAFLIAAPSSDLNGSWEKMSPMN